MRTLLLLGLLTFCSATPVLAQTTPSAPAFDISGGYAFLNDVTAEEGFHGWLAAAGFNLSDPLAIVVEFGRHAKDLDALDLGIAEVSISSFMVGPRYALRRSPRLTPYAQVLLGGIRGSLNLLGESDSSSEFALQPGGGVDIWFSRSVGVRAGGDYRRIFADDGVNEFRLHVGVVFGLRR